MNLPPAFDTQFCDTSGTTLPAGLLYTYASGTTTPQTTYQDQAGAVANTNPIVLDAAGRCDLWLSPTLEYKFVLKRADLTTVETWDDVSGSAISSGVVTSVNTETGAVTLTAPDIGFTTGTSTTWFAGTDISAALDDIISEVDTVKAAQTAANSAVVTYAGNSTLAIGDKGKTHYKTDASSVTIPAGVFAAGDVVWIVNGNSITPMNVLQGAGLALYGSAIAASGSRVLGVINRSQVWFATASLAFLIGSGIT